MSRLNELDQYYTKRDLAQSYLDVVVDRYGTNNNFLEPSAGTGAFLRDDLNILALDIEPKHPEVISVTNFLHVNLHATDYITIGNPPFSIDVQFFNHAAKFSNVIAFIIPRSWRKASVINRLNPYFHLIHDETCPDNAFILDSEEWNVSTCFQIWERKPEKRKKITFKGTYFNVVKREDDWDFILRCYGSRSGEILPKDYTGNETTVRFIKSNLNNLEDVINSIDWTERKYNVSSVPTINPIEIEEEIERKLNEVSL